MVTASHSREATESSSAAASATEPDVLPRTSSRVGSHTIPFPARVVPNAEKELRPTFYHRRAVCQLPHRICRDGISCRIGSPDALPLGPDSDIVLSVPKMTAQAPATKRFRSLAAPRVRTLGHFGKTANTAARMTIPVDWPERRVDYSWLEFRRTIWMIPQTIRTPPRIEAPTVLSVPRIAILPDSPPIRKTAPIMMFHIF